MTVLDLLPFDQWTAQAGGPTGLNVNAAGYIGQGIPGGDGSITLTVPVTVAASTIYNLGAFFDLRNVTDPLSPSPLLALKSADGVTTYGSVGGTVGQAVWRQGTATVPGGVTSALLVVDTNDVRLAVGAGISVGYIQAVQSPGQPVEVDHPGVSDTAWWVYTHLCAWHDQDGPATGWLLLHFCEAFSGLGMDDIAQMVLDSADGPGWSAALDYTRAPTSWLPWLAQFSGASAMPWGGSGLRNIIAAHPAFQKGKPAGIIAAAKLWLNPPAVVELHERDAGDPYKVTVVVLVDQVTIDAWTATGPNMVTGTDYGFEAGAGQWAAAGNCTVATSTAEAWEGTHSLAMTSSAAGAMSIWSHGGTGAFPVVPGTTYRVTARVRAATVGRFCLAEIFWTDAGGVNAGTPGGPLIADTVTGWTDVTIIATAPSNAAHGQLVVRVNGAGAAGEVHYVDGVTLEPITAGQLAKAVGLMIPAGMNYRLEQAAGSSYAAVERDYPVSYTQMRTDFPGTYATAATYHSPTDLTTIGT